MILKIRAHLQTRSRLPRADGASQNYRYFHIAKRSDHGLTERKAEYGMVTVVDDAQSHRVVCAAVFVTISVSSS